MNWNDLYLAMSAEWKVLAVCCVVCCAMALWESFCPANRDQHGPYDDEVS